MIEATTLVRALLIAGMAICGVTISGASQARGQSTDGNSVPRFSNTSGTPGRAFGVDRLNANSGALLRNISVGKAPTAVAVDAQTARVFVLNRDSQAVSVLDANA